MSRILMSTALEPLAKLINQHYEGDPQAVSHCLGLAIIYLVYPLEEIEKSNHEIKKASVCLRQLYDSFHQVHLDLKQSEDKE